MSRLLNHLREIAVLRNFFIWGFVFFSITKNLFIHLAKSSVQFKENLVKLVYTSTKYY